MTGGVEKAERLTHDGQLHGFVAGFATGVTQGKIHVEKAGHAAVLDNVASRAKHHGRQTIGFQVSGNQTHGLVADRSQRYQQGQVNLVLPAELQNCGRVLFHGGPFAVLCGHAEKTGSQAADSAFADKTVQLFDG